MVKLDIVGLGEKYVKKENMAIDEIKLLSLDSKDSPPNKEGINISIQGGKI